MFAPSTQQLRITAFALALLAPLPVLAADPIAKTDGEKTGLSIEVTELKRSSGDTLTLRFNLVNDSAEAFKPGGWYFGDYKDHQNQDIGNLGAITLIDAVGRKKYFVVRDTDQNCICSNGIPTIDAKSRVALWARFPGATSWHDEDRSCHPSFHSDG